MSLNLVKRYQLYQVLAEMWGLPFINLLETKPDPALVRCFSSEVLVRRRIVRAAREQSRGYCYSGAANRRLDFTDYDDAGRGT